MTITCSITMPFRLSLSHSKIHTYCIPLRAPHQEMADADFAEAQTSADFSSVSSDEDEEPQFQSMTAKGVQHLCSELLELKHESDQEFQQIVFSNYAAFLAILKEMNSLQNEVLRLKYHASSQKRVIIDIYDGIYSRVLPDDTVGSVYRETLFDEPSESILETHTESVSEILDSLISERRVDDAVALLEMEADFVQNLQLGEKISSDQLTLYDSTISEKRAILVDHLVCVAKHPRLSAPELQKALLGLCQLGENRLATDLMLQYYTTRIEFGMSNLLQSSKELPGLLFIPQVAKLVCSLISQAVGSFVALHGETYPYSLELSPWASEEIKKLAACLCEYIESLMETSGRLSIAIRGMQIAASYCSLLEKQRIVLQPCLIEHMRPCIEKILQLHIDHLKKVISIFTLTDTWALGKYHVPGILTGRRSRAIANQQLEYFFLSSSGWKFATLLQTVVEDISPLIALEMERSVLQGIIGLFTSYVVIIERAFTGDTNATDEGHQLGINLCESLVQGVSALANLSTMMQFFSCIVRNLFDGIDVLEFEIESRIMLIQDIYSRCRVKFLDEFISNIFSPDSDHDSGSEIRISSTQGDPRIDMIPSIPYLELYLELKKLQKLEEDDSIDGNWLMNLLGEVTEAVFNWMLKKSDIWRINKESLPDHQNEFLQLILDAQFLVEVARNGGYLLDTAVNISMNIVSHVEATFVSAGLNPPRGVEDDDDDDEWPANAARKALHKLQQLHQQEAVENEKESSERLEPYKLYGPQVGSTDILFGDDNESDMVNASETGVDANEMESEIIASGDKENGHEEI